jgi:hypothetical protein
LNIFFTGNQTSLATVRRCLVEFHQFGHAEAKRHTKGMAHYRRCRTPDTVGQVRSLITSPNPHVHAHKSPREAARLLCSHGVCVSRTTVQRLTKNELAMKAVRRMNTHVLTPKQKQNRVDKCRAWLQRHRADWPRFVHRYKKVCIVCSL